MPVERTLAIIKPDAVEAGHIGEIITAIERSGLRIRAMRMVHLSRQQAEGFYHVHRGKPFFEELVTFMSRGPVVVLCLEGEDAIARWRKLMGATDPAKAEEGSLRKRFGTNIGENAVHGSDAPETAAFEVGYFFGGVEFA